MPVKAWLGPNSSQYLSESALSVHAASPTERLLLTGLFVVGVGIAGYLLNEMITRGDDD